MNSFSKDIHGTTEFRHPIDAKEREVSRSLMALLDFSETSMFHRRYSYQKTPRINDAFHNYVDIYKSWLIERGQCQNTIYTKLSRLKKFFLYIEKSGITDLGLTP